MFAGLCAGGVMALLHGLEQRNLNPDPATWPTAKGTVSRGWVKTSVMKVGNQPGPEYRNETHDVMVDYTFTARGQSFTASSIGPRQVTENEGRAEAQAIADSYVPGATIAVYYKPDRPTESRLRRVEVSSRAWLFFVLAGALTVPGALFGIWWMIFRYPRKT
jgi:hypothetical protein